MKKSANRDVHGDGLDTWIPDARSLITAATLSDDGRVDQRFSWHMLCRDLMSGPFGLPRASSDLPVHKPGSAKCTAVPRQLRVCFQHDAARQVPCRLSPILVGRNGHRSKGKGRLRSVL